VYAELESNDVHGQTEDIKTWFFLCGAVIEMIAGAVILWMLARQEPK